MANKFSTAERKQISLTTLYLLPLLENRQPSPPGLVQKSETCISFRMSAILDRWALICDQSFLSSLLKLGKTPPGHFSNNEGRTLLSILIRLESKNLGLSFEYKKELTITFMSACIKLFEECLSSELVSIGKLVKKAERDNICLPKELMNNLNSTVMDHFEFNEDHVCNIDSVIGLENRYDDLVDLAALFKIPKSVYGIVLRKMRRLILKYRRRYGWDDENYNCPVDHWINEPKAGDSARKMDDKELKVMFSSLLR